MENNSEMTDHQNQNDEVLLFTRLFTMAARLLPGGMWNCVAMCPMDNGGLTALWDAHLAVVNTTTV